MVRVTKRFMSCDGIGNSKIAWDTAFPDVTSGRLTEALATVYGIADNEGSKSLSHGFKSDRFLNQCIVSTPL